VQVPILRIVPPPTCLLKTCWNSSRSLRNRIRQHVGAECAICHSPTNIVPMSACAATTSATTYFACSITDNMPRREYSSDSPVQAGPRVYPGSWIRATQGYINTLQPAFDLTVAFNSIQHYACLVYPTHLRDSIRAGCNCPPAKHRTVRHDPCHRRMGRLLTH
jgi:hypothetical protein